MRIKSVVALMCIGLSEMLRYGRQIRFQVIIQRRLSLLEIGHIEGSYRAKRST